MKIAIHGCYDIENFGDRLLAMLLEQRIQTTMSANVRVPMIGRQGICDLLNRFEGIDYCIWGGGGYFCEATTWRATIRHLAKYVLPAAWMRTRGIPYSILCPGAGPLNSIMARRAVRYICDGARILVVRDNESRELLLAAGVQSDRIKVAADFVLSLDPTSIPEVAHKAANELLCGQKARTSIGVHLESLLAANGEAFEGACRLLLNLVEAHSDVRLVFISDHSKTIHSTYSELLARVGVTDRHIAISRQDVWVTLAVLSRVDAIITSKLHVGIAGYCVGVPTFGLWTHSKTPRFYRAIGRSDSQAPAKDWAVVLPNWVRRITSDEEKQRFVQDFAKKDELAISTLKAFEMVRSDIADFAFVS